MPKAWTSKDERQYKHIKRSSQARGGRSAKRAKEIAARTVNKQRRQEGRTAASKGTSRRGQAHGRGRRGLELSERTREELYGMARKMGIPNRSKMNKGQLLRAVRSRRT